MNVDLLAGTTLRLPPTPVERPTILVFDSGLGGLSVHAELVRARPDAQYLYVADDAAFPYGALGESELVDRVTAVLERVLAAVRPDLAVIACNTASTLVLPHLRRRFELPFIGTVPAIKPAAALSRTRRVTVLGTPGTVARDYTHSLIAAYAGDCRVDLVGSRSLAALAEAELSGAPASDDAIAAEIAPCFHADGGGRTDVVVLACTHYPLLRHRLEALAPWPVTWLDPAPAIARRATELIGGRPDVAPTSGSIGVPNRACFTGRAPDLALRAALIDRGLTEIRVEPLSLLRRDH
jgi:glutamate racemase